jgi:protein-L-isoaspartate(D-aspartate) O-methyltransferase
VPIKFIDQPMGLGMRESNIDYTELRKHMVRTQLVARGIRDPAVLEAMNEVPREAFVPAEMEQFAYADSPLPIGQGQTISQPYIVALMTRALELKPNDRVLEIGTGSGYAAAVLSRIADQVITVERHAELAHNAAEHFRQLEYDNIQVKVSNGTLGWAEQAPYDAIVVTAGGPSIPEPLLEQLEISGRLVIPVGAKHEVQQLMRVHRLNEEDYHQENLGPVRFVPLVGEAGWRGEE